MISNALHREMRGVFLSVPLTIGKADAMLRR